MNSHTNPQDSTLLTASDITFSYPARLVFDRWSCDFGTGLTWVKGRNGGGKSTLLRILGGALMPRTGKLAIEGTCSTEAPLDYRRKLFWCGPGEIPLDHLKPVEYFGFMANLFPRFDNDALRQHVAAFALVPHLDSALQSLSTGTQRKVWISAALSAGTPVILLDEPFNALDAESTEHLKLALAKFAREAKRILLIASHEDIGSARDHAAILDLTPDEYHEGQRQTAL